jgi:DNA-binding MarR family transcriptional regulator
MTDIKLSDAPIGASAAAVPSEAGFLSEEEVRQGIELLFFAYRDFTAEPDAILTHHDFGRAHHRVVHFVGRRPQMTVGELLLILKITKQSLNRVLGQLVRQGFIVQHRGAQDRRQRLLELTEKGRELERQLSAPQRARVAAAYRKAGAAAVEGFRKVLLNVIASPGDRQRFDRSRRSGR